MTKATLVEVSDYIPNPIDIGSAVFDTNRHESASLSKKSGIVPPAFDIRIELAPHDNDAMASPTDFMTAAKHKRCGVTQESGPIFLDLPGLHTVQQCLPDNDGNGAQIILRFDD